MKRHFVLSILSIAAATVLNAQGWIGRTMPFSFYVNEYPDLVESLKIARGTAVVIVSKDANEADAAKTKLDAILSDKRLLPFWVVSVSATQSDDIGKPIRESQSWTDPQTRWAFMDTKGEISANGIGLPSPEQILKALDDANVRPRLEILRQLVRRDPDLLEAQVQLLYMLQKNGDILTSMTLGMEPPVFPTGDDTITFAGGTIINGNNYLKLSATAEADSLPLLKDADDDEIWDEFVRLFGTLMPKLLPAQEAMYFPLDTFVPYSLPLSGKLKTAANNFAALVEDALQKEPSNERLWKLWVALEPKRPITQLFDSIQPGPFVAEGDWPPPVARAAYISYCRKTKDWKTVIELSEQMWDEARMMAVRAGVWADLAEPLLESYLGTNRTADAERIMAFWKDNKGWSPAFQRAARIAKEHGYDDISEKWGKIKEEPK